MPLIDDFRLKLFLNQAAGRAAIGSISNSYAELWSARELLDLEEGATDAYLNAPLGYPAMHGAASLRESVARLHGIADADAVIVSSGVDDALSLLFLGAVEAGGHVVVQAPAYQPLLSLPRWRGAQVSEWAAGADGNWGLDELRSQVRPDTRLIVLVSPHNPSGWSADEALLREVLELAERLGARVVCDEMYRGLPLGADAEAPSIASLAPNGVAIGGLAKSFGLPGLRIGWIASQDRQFIAALKRLRMYFNSCVSAPSEMLAGLALRHAHTLLERNRGIAVENLGLVRRFVEQAPQLFRVTLPANGVVCFPQWQGKGCADELSTAILAEHRLSLVPGRVFDADPQCFRLGFGTRVFKEHFETFTRFAVRRFG